MGTSRRRAAAAAAIAAAVLTAGCGDNAASPAPSTPRGTVATPSVGSPGGALAGFLRAASSQDDNQVRVWLASNTDITDLDELLRVYSGFGSAGGVFWVVSGVTVRGVAGGDAGHAKVTLSGDIVWCLGKAANDPAATCSVVNPVSSMPHTYAAVQVDGRWKADVDVNTSSGLDHNPQASPMAGGSTSSPSPT